MKKRSAFRLWLALLACMAMLMSSMSFAAATSGCQHVTMPDHSMVWYEGFENGMPAGWQTLDQDGDGYNWAFVKTSDLLWNTIFTDKSCDGEGLAVSASYLNDIYTALTPDNWLILPVQRIGEDYQLTFRYCAQDPFYPDTFGVFVSTNIAEPLNTASYVQLGSDYTTEDTYQTLTVDLSQYQNQEILIAVRHYNSYDQFIIDLDCFAMWGKGAFTPPIPSPSLPAVPKTGDESHVVLWACLMILSTIGLVAAGRKFKKAF